MQIGDLMRSDEFMNAEEVARYLHLGKNTVYQLAKTGKIASYHVGRKLRFTIEDVEAYVSSTRRAGGKAVAHIDAPSPAIQSEKEPADAQALVDAASFGAIEGEPFVIAGADEAADVIASALNAQGSPTARLMQGSYTALVNLYADEADAAVINLYDQASNSWNIPYVRNLAPGASVVVIRLLGRKQGLIVRDRNPKHLTTWGGLLHEGVRLSNRTKGSGSRVLLDEKLRALDARSETIEGYSSQADVGSIAVRRVANGLADVAIGNEREAMHVPGVEFVPLQAEWVDFVIRKNEKTRPVIRKLHEILASGAVRSDLSSLAPCDASKLGVVIYES